MIHLYVNVLKIRISCFIDLVVTWYDASDWYKNLFATGPSSIIDIEVKVIDIEFS